MEGVVAHSPGRRALVLHVRDLVGLAIDAGLHDVVLADGAVIDVHVPGPQGDSVPLFDLESFLCGRLYHCRCCGQFGKINYILAN